MMDLSQGTLPVAWIKNSITVSGKDNTAIRQGSQGTDDLKTTVVFDRTARGMVWYWSFPGHWSCVLATDVLYSVEDTTLAAGAPCA